jgi:DNA topoisomerase-2
LRTIACIGHLSTLSNYNDNERKITGGRNGYGIINTELIVEIVDGSLLKLLIDLLDLLAKNTVKCYYMSVMENLPNISSYSEEKYTMINFKSDFQKFNMSNDLMMISCYDLAGRVKDANGERLKIRNLFGGIEPTTIYKEVNQRWEIGFVPSPERLQRKLRK